LDKKLFRLDVKSWRASIMLHGGRWITLRLLMESIMRSLGGMGLGEARLVLREDGDLYLDAAFSRTVTLPEMSANAKVIAVDVDENFIVHGNDDFVKSF